MDSLPHASSLPAGFHTAMPYLIFDGTAAQAIAFYREAFGATELPGRLTDPAGRVLDAGIMIGDSVIRVGDEAPWRIAKSPRTLGGASSFVHLYVADADAVIARAVALGAKILLPIKDQFYGDRAGSIADPFEQAWTIATHKEDISPEELKRRFTASLRSS
ncbi:MAG: VOC family protein [Candidatus Acidiferrales bacterium]